MFFFLFCVNTTEDRIRFNASSAYVILAFNTLSVKEQFEKFVGRKIFQKIVSGRTFWNFVCGITAWNFVCGRTFCNFTIRKDFKSLSVEEHFETLAFELGSLLAAFFRLFCLGISSAPFFDYLASSWRKFKAPIIIWKCYLISELMFIILNHQQCFCFVANCSHFKSNSQQCFWLYNQTLLRFPA